MLEQKVGVGTTSACHAGPKDGARALGVVFKEENS